MSTEQVEHTSTSPSGSGSQVGAIVLQVLGVLSIFVAAYLATETLLTNGYDSGAIAIRMGVACMAALIAAGALFLARRFKQT